MKSLKAALWFIRSSWGYLGCDQGNGRWAMRRRYVRGVWWRTAWFVIQDWKDRREVRA